MKNLRQERGYLDFPLFVVWGVSKEAHLFSSVPPLKVCLYINIAPTNDEIAFSFNLSSSLLPMQTAVGNFFFKFQTQSNLVDLLLH